MLRSGGARIPRAAQRESESDMQLTGINRYSPRTATRSGNVDRTTTYSACSLYTGCSLQGRFTEASIKEPSSDLATPLDVTRAQRDHMPQQSYPFANLTVRPRQAAHWYSTVLPIPPNPRLPIYSDLHNYSPSRMNVLVHHPSPREVDLYQAVFGILRVQIGSLAPM